MLGWKEPMMHWLIYCPSLSSCRWRMNTCRWRKQRRLGGGGGEKENCWTITRNTKWLSRFQRIDHKRIETCKMQIDCSYYRIGVGIRIGTGIRIEFTGTSTHQHNELFEFISSSSKKLESEHEITNGHVKHQSCHTLFPEFLSIFSL